MTHGVTITNFQNFFAEVLRIRAEIAAATAPAGPAATPGFVPDAEITARQLQTLLERQLARDGNQEACYAMAALVDDIFLHDIIWPGHNSWRDMLLEYRMFHSHVAGDEIFARIAQLLQTRGAAQTELAQLYLLVLQQGFQGGLRGADACARRQDYARQLYEFVYRRAPDPGREDRHPFPQALAHTLVGPPLPPRRFGGSGSWIATAFVVILLLASQVAWMSAASGIAAAASGTP